MREVWYGESFMQEAMAGVKGDMEELWRFPTSLPLVGVTYLLFPPATKTSHIEVSPSLFFLNATAALATSSNFCRYQSLLVLFPVHKSTLSNTLTVSVTFDVFGRTNSYSLHRSAN